MPTVGHKPVRLQLYVQGSGDCEAPHRLPLEIVDMDVENCSAAWPSVVREQAAKLWH